jgi:hypothetical protein
MFTFVGRRLITEKLLNTKFEQDPLIQSGIIETNIHTHIYIQGVPGGKLHIVGGHDSSIGHSKQKTVYVQVSFSERIPR